jgi:O-antigen/teichoic acid export membrane protein
MPLAGASTSQTGFAAIAAGVAAAGTATMIGTQIVQLPRLVELRERDPEEAERQATVWARVALAIAMAAALPAALLARPGLELALGDDFAGARGALELALPAVPFGAILGLASLTAALRLRPGSATRAWGFGAAVFLAVGVATIPSLDAEGAALAVTSAVVVTSVAATAILGGRGLREVCAASLAGAALVLGAGQTDL